MAEFLGSKTISNQFLGNKVILRMYKGDNLINEYEPLYNPPSDWSDIRTDCPENSIALYAAQGFGILVKGSPSSSNGIATDFDSRNYFYVDNFPMNSKTNWEVNIKANTQFNDSQQRLIFFPTGYLRCIGLTPTWNLLIDGQEFWLGTVEDYPYIRIKRDGTNIYGYSSTDGENYTLKGTIENATLNDGTLSFGGAQSGSLPWAGSIDLNNLSVKVDDALLTSYDNLGFTASCTGGYTVFIDGIQYGSTYASSAQCDITWSTSGISTGDNIITPIAMKAHKIWITPATEGNNITAFHFARVAASGTEQQSLLWAHFNITNQISLSYFANDGSSYTLPLLKSITSKNNKLSTNSLYYAFNGTALEYVPDFNFPSNMSYLLDSAFYGTKIKNITIKDTALEELVLTFYDCQDIEKIKFKNVDFSGLTSAKYMLTNASKLKDTVIDFSSATGLKGIDAYGDSSHFISGLKGLRVSSSAPFNYAYPPQINVSYTGMDRQALVQLFNDLPYNVGYTEVGSPTIVDGVLTPTTDVNTYVKADTNLTFNSNSDLEIYCRFKTDAEIPSNNAVVIIGDAVAASKMFCYYYSGWVYFLNLAFDNYTWRVVQPNTWYRAKLTAKNGVWNSYVYDDNENLLGELQSTPTPFGDVTVTIPFGKAPGYENAPVPGGIDLNNTYIKVNDVYWFRGQPAMTKTINVVGCTGTANLTTDDKAIVTDKRWSLTWS